MEKSRTITSSFINSLLIPTCFFLSLYHKSNSEAQNHKSVYLANVVHGSKWETASLIVAPRSLATDLSPWLWPILNSPIDELLITFAASKMRRYPFPWKEPSRRVEVLAGSSFAEANALTAPGHILHGGVKPGLMTPALANQSGPEAAVVTLWTAACTQWNVACV